MTGPASSLRLPGILPPSLRTDLCAGTAARQPDRIWVTTHPVGFPHPTYLFLMSNREVCSRDKLTRRNDANHSRGGT